MSTSNELLKRQLMEVTDLDEERASTVLEINNYNLEQAINYHLESSEYIDIPPNNATTRNTLPNQECEINNIKRENKNENNNLQNNSDKSFVSENASIPDICNVNNITSTNLDNNQFEDNVRAPIPSKREQLLLPEEDQFDLHYNGVNARKRRLIPPTRMFTYCPFRDFAREAQIQEELSEQFNNFAYDSIDGSQNSSLPDALNYITPATSTKETNETTDKKRMTARFKRSAYNYNDFNNMETFQKSFSKPTKRKRLEDLFRPPMDLLFWGTFQAARDHATVLNKWLIVNLQDQREFKSQILNRDVWSDKDIKELILQNFILWQISMESPEGLRFKTFYHVSECPYVCVLDPRTGEERLICDTTKPKILYDELMKFLSESDFCLDITLKITKPTSSRTASSTATSNSISGSSENSKTNDDKKLKSNNCKTLDLSEEDQLELAIKNSLKETQCSVIISDDRSSNFVESDTKNTFNVEKQSNNSGLNASGSNCDFVEFDLCSDNSTQFDKSSSKCSVSNDLINLLSKKSRNICVASYKNYIGNRNDSLTKIQIRLPNGERNELSWPCSTIIKGLKLYICENYPDITKDTFKLIQSYPRKNIFDLDDDMTLMDAKLHPTSILYLHPDE